MRKAILIAGALAMTGCATTSPSLVTGGAVNRTQGTPLMIENGTAVPLRVYALTGGYEMPLGRVEALDHESMRIPYGIGTSVRLVARPSVNIDDRRRHMSQPVQLVKGHRLAWELRASPGVSDVPRLSTLRVFACADTGC